MFWLHCGLFVLVIAVSGFISSLADTTSKRGNACLLTCLVYMYIYISLFSFFHLSCLLACLYVWIQLAADTYIRSCDSTSWWLGT